MYHSSIVQALNSSIRWPKKIDPKKACFNRGSKEKQSLNLKFLHAINIAFLFYEWTYQFLATTWV